MSNVNAVALTIVFILFLVVTVVGFAAARWRRAENTLHLDEWGLGGRGFGTFVTWFLLGGDLYTAYTFIAVPARSTASGAAGFFAVPYTIMVFPIVFVFLPRLWSVSRLHGYVTPADFVRGRYGSSGLALAVARHRHPGHHALHRPATGRHPGRADVMGIGAASPTGSSRTCRC